MLYLLAMSIICHIVSVTYRDRLDGHLNTCMRVYGQTFWDINNFPYERAYTAWLDRHNVADIEATARASAGVTALEHARTKLVQEPSYRRGRYGGHGKASKKARVEEATVDLTA